MNSLSSPINDTPVKSADLDQTFIASYSELEDGFQTPEAPMFANSVLEPPTIDRFSRSAIDKAFGAGTSSKGFNKIGQKTGDVATSSPAVKAGLVRTCIDGSIDQRCIAVQQGLVVVDEDGGVSKAQSVMCSKQIVLTESGDISQASAAVKSGLVKLTKGDKVDLRSTAVQRGWLIVDENGDVEVKKSALCQTLHLKETNGAHIHGFETADKITQLFGLKYTKEEAVRMVLAINDDSNVRTKTRGGNMSEAITAPKGSGDLAVDRVIAAALEDAKGGTAVKLTKHVAQRAERIAKNILSGDFPVEFKEAARELFSKLTNENGHNIVRSNAKLTTPDGADTYCVTTKAVPKNLVGAFEDAASTAEATRKDEQHHARKPSKQELDVEKELQRAAELQREADRQRADEQQREAERQRAAERLQEAEKMRAQERQREVDAEQQREAERQRAAERQREADRQQRAAEQQREMARVAEQERIAARVSEERRQRALQTYNSSTSSYYSSAYISHYSPYSGSFSGNYHSSSGSANGSALFSGPRGGTYYINSSGNKSYV